MRTVYAASLSFPAPAESVWTEVCSWVEQWYSRKAGAVPLPSDWRSGTNGTIAPLDRHSLELATHAGGAGLDGVLREVRWRYPDQYDPSLIWASDVAVFETAEEVLFTLTLRIASFDFELLPAKFQLGNPRIVRKLVARGDARIGRHVVADVAERVEASAVPDLVDDLLDPHRRHPIVVLSPDPYTDRYGADQRPIAESLAGSASVCALATKWATFALTDELGKQFSCFNGAMRIYWPRFTLQSDPFFHRLWLPDHIARAEQGDRLALELMKIVAAAGAFRFVEPEKIRTFRRRLEEARLESLRAAKGNDYEELFSEWDKATKELADAQAKIEDLTRENVTLRDNFLTVVTAQAEVPSVDVADAPESERTEVSNVREAVEEAQRRTSRLEYLPDASGRRRSRRTGTRRRR
jgi:hypothetical protein